MKKYLNYKNIIAFSILPQIIMVEILSHYPEFIETYYSRGLYPIISTVLRYLFMWIPFSFGDVLYTMLGGVVLYAIIKKKTYLWRNPIVFFRTILMGTSILYFGFHLFWGMNYHRQPLYKTLNISDNYDTSTLIKITKKFLKKTNKTHLEIVSSDSLAVDIPYNKNTLLDKTTNGYKQLAKKFAHLNYSPKSLKKSIYSTILTYLGYSGYINPFTGEAQVNGIIPKSSYPITACHEEAHQLGFSAENEANFIGFLAAVHNEDIYFRYEAYAFALKYCFFELKKSDLDTYKELIASTNTGVLKGYRKSSDFWNQYENFVEPIVKKGYDTYLKANNQKKGIQSYNYMVALLVNYYKNKSL